MLMEFLFLMQYQNVFAPLVKLEADYDKVCLLTSDLFLFYSPYASFVENKHLSNLHVLNFVPDDERISEQGQSHH
jgi:hypothetical protein